MPPRPLIREKCRKCRERKIKCDNQHPSCGPCQRSSLECQYEKHTTFINYASTGSPGQPATVCSTNQDGQLLKQSSASRRHCHSSVPEIVSPSLRPAVSSSLVYKEALSSSFIVRYYPQDRHLWIDICSWIFPALDGLHYAPLKAASTALGLAMMGFSTDNESSKKQSVACYITSMEQLRVACQLSVQHRFKNILTCLLLLAYETIHPMFISSKSTNSHILGLASLIQLAGPEAFQEGQQFQAFSYARFLLLVEAARTPTQSFLSKTRWLQVPWRKTPKSKLHHYLDCVADIPLLQQQLQHVLTIPASETRMNPDHCCVVESASPSSSPAGDLLKGVVALSRRLDQLFALFEGQQGISDSLGDMEIVSTCDRSFFPNVEDRAAKISYWRARILLHDITWRLAEHFCGDPAVLVCGDHVELWSRIQGNALRAAEESILLLPLGLGRKQGLVAISSTAESLEMAALVFGRLRHDEQKKECLKHLKGLELSSWK